MNISVLLAPLLLLGSGSACPVGWTDAGGEFCYLTSPNKMNWHSSGGNTIYSSALPLTSQQLSSSKPNPKDKTAKELNINELMNIFL